jgi:hypothetical protein
VIRSDADVVDIDAEVSVVARRLSNGRMDAADAKLDGGTAGHERSNQGADRAAFRGTQRLVERVNLLCRAPSVHEVEVDGWGRGRSPVGLVWRFVVGAWLGVGSRRAVRL